MMQIPECTTVGCGHFLGRNRVNLMNRSIFILMLGLDNSGKTCTAKSIVGESMNNLAPTIGFSKVVTKYKGFKVNLFDLGGSKTFRGIWPKYFHEVHGFIFVVDASDAQRLEETGQVFAEILAHEKVQGKPILMLCNKADVDDAKDEVHIVNALQVEQLVNQAKCPTRVEPSIATKNQGLREGYKWLIKSIIARLDVLGPRVDKDIDDERLRENERKAEVRRRIEERRKNGGRESLENSEDDAGQVPGFVPIEELTSKLEKLESGERNGLQNTESNEEPVETSENLDPVEQPIVPDQDELTSRRSSEDRNSRQLELEPISKPKKETILKKMNSRGSVISKPSSSKSNSSAGSRGAKL